MPRLSSLRWRFPQKPVSGPAAQTPVGLMGRVKGMMVCFCFFRENEVGLNNRDALSVVTISQLELQRLHFLYTTTQLYGGKMKQTSKYQNCTCGRLQRLCLFPQIPVLKCPTLNKKKNMFTRWYQKRCPCFCPQYGGSILTWLTWWHFIKASNCSFESNVHFSTEYILFYAQFSSNHTCQWIM